MVGKLLLRGMIAGVVAGLIAFGFARLYGEPAVDRAIAFEEQTSQAKGEAPGEELVSRTTQAGIGLATALVVFCASVGGLFSLVFAFVYGRLGPLRARSTAALLALGAFIAIALVPLMKYPANPPAVGDPETIGARTELFMVMLIISLLALVLAVLTARRYWSQWGGWNASMLAGGLFLAIVGVAHFALPPINEVPENFSADVLWQFRVAVLGIQFLLWSTLGLLFGVLAERSLAERR
ncbi:MULTISPECIES: CbtA family protein [Rhodomicrobium]|uniref:CbtA family protein n=1 Tax=Rhodomicrobium TaxID=1068 RepID=UPI000B4AC553|nr:MULTISPECIES: CbtA family protein [Rhodomicrobium]